jgi:hypothetical protein
MGLLLGHRAGTARCRVGRGAAVAAVARVRAPGWSGAATAHLDEVFCAVAARDAQPALRVGRYAPALLQASRTRGSRGGVERRRRRGAGRGGLGRVAGLAACLRRGRGGRVCGTVGGRAGRGDRAPGPHAGRGAVSGRAAQGLVWGCAGPRRCLRAHERTHGWDEARLRTLCGGEQRAGFKR